MDIFFVKFPLINQLPPSRLQLFILIGAVLVLKHMVFIVVLMTDPQIILAQAWNTIVRLLEPNVVVLVGG